VGPPTLPTLFLHMESAKLYPRDIGKKKIEDTWKANQHSVTLKVATMMIFRIRLEAWEADKILTLPGGVSSVC